MLLLLGMAQLVGTGLAAGDMFCTALGLSPMMLALPYRRYVEMVQFLQPRYDPVLPILNTATLIAGLFLAAVSGTARVLYIGADLLVAAVIAISVLRAVPINKYVLSLDPAEQPADWLARDPRRSWRNWHLVRTTLMVCALVTSAAAIANLN